MRHRISYDEIMIDYVNITDLTKKMQVFCNRFRSF